MSQTGTFPTISTAIVSIIEAVQQEEGNAFAAVYDYPTVESTLGTPFATVVPSDSPSNYLNIAQNLRSYVFFIDIYYPIEANDEGYQNAFANMRVLIESCLNALDNSNGLNGTSQITLPAPSNWSMTQSSIGTLLDGRIVITAKVSVPQNNG